MQASKLILYCWTFQKPLTRLTTQSSSGSSISMGSGTALSWIRAFLGNWSQTVVLEGEESGSVPVTSGVPKGISDSDDGTVLQIDLGRLSAWESLWDMEFNPSKCQVVRLTTANEVINTVYTLHGQSQGCHKCKVLGGGHLQWPNLELPHRQNYWKCKSNLRIHPEKHQNKKNPKVRETAYNTLVCPQLEYSTPVWDPSSKDKTHQLGKSKEGLHAGPPVIMIQGQVFQPCSTS